jgi:hypothetical protein
MFKQLAFAIVLIAAPPLLYGADNVAELQRKINTINQHSEKLLGISLTALLYLNDASPNSYFLLDHLEKSGKINDIKELESKAYVRLEIVDQLPDGQIVGKQLRIIPTALGYQIQTCMRNITTASTRTPKSGAQ